VQSLVRSDGSRRQPHSGRMRAWAVRLSVIT
jgi:hypothetical protein